MTIPLKWLERELKKLDPDQGRLARRNARRRVAKELKAIQKQVDAEFPTIRLAVKPGRKKLTVQERVRALKRKGIVSFNHGTDAHAVGLLAQAGIRVRHVRGLSMSLFVPTWVNYLSYSRATEYDTLNTLRILKKDPAGQKALIAEWALANDRDVANRRNFEVGETMVLASPRSGKTARMLAEAGLLPIKAARK